MSKVIVAGGGLVAFVVMIPLLALLAVLGAGAAAACPGGGLLAAGADVPSRARPWIAATHQVCPQLPEPWIAAVMAQESAFDPDAYADDVNGGTWGLFQLNAEVWRSAYGAPWSTDRDGNGNPDVRDPSIHARVAGEYLCTRLAGVRALRSANPQWRSTVEVGELDALIVAHNAGESRLATYPDIPTITSAFLRDVHDRVGAWSDCVMGVGAVPGDGRRPAEAIRVALSMVGTRSGWYRLCDRLVCRAYGHANSGYPTAIAHWSAMLAGGHARPGDRCPPAGAFVYWAPATAGDPGHVALVTTTDPYCDPRRIAVVSNDVGDSVTGALGGVYRVSLAGIESGFVDPARYLGWSLPVCAGELLTASASTT